MPVLFLTGSEDKAVASVFLEHYASLNAAFRCLSIRGPHILNIENPQGFNQAVLDFVKQQGTH
jgi:pimeloyl-ACP methyl ester carboxylesterase